MAFPDSSVNDGGSWSQLSQLPPKMRQSAGGTASGNLKRSLSMSNGSIPSLPKLSGDIILEVFTHRSLRFEGAPQNEEFGDNDRLAELGERVLVAAVTFCLFSKRPMLSANEIISQRDSLLSENMDGWISNYRLREKLRCSHDALPSINSPKETRLLFTSYVGAVFAQSGFRVVQDWISRLVDPESDPPALPEPEVQMPLPMPPKRFKSESLYAMPISPPPAPPPPVAAPPPPPLPPTPVTPMPSIVPSVGMSYLQIFNQTANQRRVAVDYPSEFAGPPHAGMWNVKCIVNGVERGRGTGQSKQIAKEEAARQAFYSMGWAQYHPNLNGSQRFSDSPVPSPMKVEPNEPAVPPPPPPSHPPPPQPSLPPPPLPNPLAPAQPSMAFLPLFNQTANQRRHTVDYVAEFAGPPHAGSWHVRCIVDGIEKGKGVGVSKQVAKEDAARQAYYTMGWAPRMFFRLSSAPS
ncbi:hypothetical protein JAAARDRAFT_188818 [Jaapia argillacea MUCL 33604]|uniref:DRBM domain-containing protein n=1 Tax=Jaapia argillacea MUCL 33604 TaxID=933084 RepID=A0A067QI68_9AGAM|nr:hypothetical protein JAAARDRAFT_188818 [Jaapia argillacea MUCL 33604]